jgi:hypothetical protein
MKGDILFIFDTGSMLVAPDFFPRSDDPAWKEEVEFICT